MAEFMLLLEVMTQMGSETWIVDYGMSLTDCMARAQDWAVYNNPDVTVTCELVLK